MLTLPPAPHSPCASRACSSAACASRSAACASRACSSALRLPRLQLRRLRPPCPAPAALASPVPSASCAVCLPCPALCRPRTQAPSSSRPPSLPAPAPLAPFSVPHAPSPAHRASQAPLVSHPSRSSGRLMRTTSTVIASIMAGAWLAPTLPTKRASWRVICPGLGTRSAGKVGARVQCDWRGMGPEGPGGGLVTAEAVDLEASGPRNPAS
jgi:hypothetical protein